MIILNFTLFSWMAPKLPWRCLNDSDPFTAFDLDSTNLVDATMVRIGRYMDATMVRVGKYTDTTMVLEIFL